MMGTINGKMLTFPRIVYAMAKRRDLPFSRYLAYLTPKAKAPVVATVFIIVLATVMMIFFFKSIKKRRPFNIYAL